MIKIICVLAGCGEDDESYLGSVLGAVRLSNSYNLRNQMFAASGTYLLFVLVCGHQNGHLAKD